MSKTATAKKVKEAFDEHNKELNLPLDPDRQGLTEAKAKMVEILARTGHTDAEICNQLSINKEVLNRWLKTAEEHIADGCETIYTQLRDAIIGPRMEIVQTLKATLIGKAIGAYKSVSTTTQTKNKKGELVSVTETTAVPSSNDIKYLLEKLAPEEYGGIQVNAKIKLEAMVPMSPILEKDEWAQKYARPVQGDNIVDAEIDTEEDKDEPSSK